MWKKRVSNSELALKHINEAIEKCEKELEKKAKDVLAELEKGCSDVFAECRWKLIHDGSKAAKDLFGKLRRLDDVKDSLCSALKKCRDLCIRQVDHFISKGSDTQFETETGRWRNTKNKVH